MSMSGAGRPRDSNAPRRVLLLSGASRGIGHATVKRFSAAGWRVITISRQPFPEQCPWEMGPEDHIQLDLTDPDATAAAAEEIKERLKPEGGREEQLRIHPSIGSDDEPRSRPTHWNQRRGGFCRRRGHPPR